MTKEALVIFVNLIIYQSLLAHQLTIDTFLETFYDFLQNRLIENHLLTTHAGSHIATGQEFPTLQDNTIATCIKNIHPELLIQDFSRENQYLYVRILFLGIAADFYTHRSGTAQTKIEKHEVRQLLFDEFPIAHLTVSCSDNLSFGYIVFENSFRTFQFQRYILYYDYFKIVHHRLFESMLNLCFNYL